MNASTEMNYYFLYVLIFILCYLLVIFVITYKRKVKDETMATPETEMKEAFESLKAARESMNKAADLYKQRGSIKKADAENRKNVESALHYLALAYDEVSAIKENDLK